MFSRLFNEWFKHLEEDHVQLGCRDRDAGQLPKLADSGYLKGYFANRPIGLDGEVQFFPTIEEYLQWKQQSRGTKFQ